MSRKNRNASHRSYSRVHYKPNHLAPTPMDRMIEEANRSTPNRLERTDSHVIMINERIGYQYTFLTSAVLETDISYQRRMNAAQVDKIVNEFNPLLVNAVKVSNRDGRFFVFDGAHTLAALRRIHEGKPFMVECKVFSGMTYQEEAELFALQTGTSRTVSFDYKLRAKLAAETPKGKAFLEATESAGLHLADVQRSSMRYVIAAKATAQRIFENYGSDLYTDMLRLIVETWDAVEWSLSKPVLNGCAVFLSVYGDEYKRDRFIRKLAYTNADELAAIARRQNVKDQPRQYALAILELYNKGGRGRLDESRVQR